MYKTNICFQCLQFFKIRNWSLINIIYNLQSYFCFMHGFKIFEIAYKNYILSLEILDVFQTILCKIHVFSEQRKCLLDIWHQTELSQTRAKGCKNVGKSRAKGCKNVGKSRAKGCKNVGKSRAKGCKNVGKSRAKGCKNVRKSIAIRV